MKQGRMLAKSQKAGEPWHESLTLPGHLAEVHRAALQILASTAEHQLQALGLRSEQFRERLERVVLLAAATHDLGKANDHFQGMLANARQGKPQGLRHEWVSLLLLETTPIREWLLPAVAVNEVDWQVGLWAIAGHHPAYGRPSPPRLFVDGSGQELEVFAQHPDFRSCLNFLSESFKLATPPEFSREVWPLVGPNNVFVRIFRWFQQGNRIWGSLKDQDRRFVAAVKNCLVAADVAGSALPREVRDQQRRRTWIPEAFVNVPPSDRIRAIVERRLNKKVLRPFQEEVGKSAAPVTFVKGGCGSGKTLAGYHWAASQHPGRRLYFCYPTTGTATEGFRDYLYNPDESFDAKLFHGRAHVDLEILGVKGDADRDETETVARIESLDAWSTPIVSCTVDTVLGIVQNNRRGRYAWPALAGAAFIFDEIHAYDDKLFGALLRFLQALPGVPVLLMTASLPRARLESLKLCLRRRGEELPIISGPPDLESLPRYHRQGAIDSRDPLPEVSAEIQGGGKVLWVCNTVNRAIRAAMKASEINPILYHSRFRYEDRVEQHRRVIEAFNASGAALAICTQVAEMSLDLSATLLVTDLAPVPAIIQRLGRLNRRAGPGDQTRPFIILEPEDDDGKPAVLPYAPEDFVAARKWLGALGEGQLCQADLAGRWEEQDADERPAYVGSAWLDGGPTTQVLELREASPGLTVVLERDLPALKAGKPVVRLALPMPPPPKGLDWRKWPDFKGIPVAPDGVIEYDQERGARWRKC
jgi:CRISPR-associated endonuclease/helicase Cas3